ncbi:MAG: PorT family protein [Firmicutes bacterium]|nr:PorT family protein [Bacillota bacterium]MCM1401918.1 PorT family protein [Bacteroides sp.]MCM1476660.1 PorT family protein [Bacteroides sp.]
MNTTTRRSNTKRIALRLIAVMLFALTSASGAYAQLRYGFSFGGSFAKASLSHAPGYTMNNRSGFRGGLMLEYQMPTSGWAFDFAVLYERYNTRLHEAASDKNLCFGRNFIELPLNVKYKFWLSQFNNLFAPMIETGPALMVNLDSDHGTPMFKQKHLQPAWNFGVGFDAANILQLKFGYRLGLGNALHRFEQSPQAKLRTSGFYLSANILFDF